MGFKFNRLRARLGLWLLRFRGAVNPTPLSVVPTLSAHDLRTARDARTVESFLVAAEREGLDMSHKAIVSRLMPEWNGDALDGYDRPVWVDSPLDIREHLALRDQYVG